MILGGAARWCSNGSSELQGYMTFGFGTAPRRIGWGLRAGWKCRCLRMSQRKSNGLSALRTQLIGLASVLSCGGFTNGVV